MRSALLDRRKRQSQWADPLQIHPSPFKRTLKTCWKADQRNTGGMYALESKFDQHMPIKTKTLIAGRDIVSDSMSVFYTLF